MELNEQQKKVMELVDSFSAKFMELKECLLKLGLPDSDNLRIGIMYLDDGYLRGREAIMALSQAQPAPADKEPANDAETVVDVDLKTAAAH